MQILVLGMHRSGTSAITRLITMMGAEIGPAHLIGGPAADNEKGFWERTDVSQLNDRLLETVDCVWDDVASFSPDRFEQADFPALREQAQQIVFQMDARRPWVLKDPRLCLTLPVWRPLLEVPVCILPYRSPLEIAKSLETRNSLPLLQGITLWEQYTLAALNASQGLPRIGISYSRLIQDPVATVRELYEQLCQADVVGLRMPSDREILAFVEQRLQHQRVNAEDTDGILNISQRILAQAMEDGAALEWSSIPKLSAGASEVLQEAQHQRAQQARFEAELTRSQEEARSLRLELDTRDARIEQLAADLATVHIDIQARDARIEHLTADLATVHTDIQARDARIEHLTADLATVHTDIQARDARIEQLVADLTSAQTDVEARNARIEQLSADIEQLLFEELAAGRSEADAVRERLELAHEELADLSSKLRAVQADASAKDERIAQLCIDVASGRMETREIQRRLAIAQGELTTLTGCLQQSRMDGTAKDQRIVALSEEASSAHADAAETRRQLASAQNEVAALNVLLQQTQAGISAKDERIHYLSSEINLLSRWIDDIERSFNATLLSWRWRIGNSAVRGVESLILRPKPRLAIDHIAAVLRQFHIWLPNGGRPSNRSAETPASSASPTMMSRESASALFLPHELPFPADNSTNRHDAIHIPNDDLEHHARGYAVLCLPIIEWGFRFQRPQQLARCLAQNGHSVYYVSTNFGPALSLDPIEPGVTGIRLPGRAETNVYQDLPRPAETGVIVEALLDFMSGIDHPHWICLVQLPYWSPVAAALRERVGCRIVYDCMDDHLGFSTNHPQIAAAETRLLAEADLVIASSQVLMDKVAPAAGHKRLIRNAVDYAHFAAVAPTRHAPMNRLRIGYYGAIADWFDSVLVSELAKMRPDWEFILIGSTFSAETAPLEARTNIRLPGEQPYADLPGLIADWDCCIIPFKRIPLTEATNPVKVYEMLAAGKSVVAVSLPELKPMAELGLIALADTAETFALAIEEQVSQDSLQKQRQRRDYASLNTWESRCQDLDEEIRALFPLVSILIVTYNNRDLNRMCLASVLRDTDYPNIEVIVVDNASSDGTPALLRELAVEDPRLKVILNDSNKGFAAANNQALAIATGAYLCLLNNDTIVAGAWLSTLVNHLRRNPQIGLIGPVTNAIGNEAQVPVGYHEIIDMPRWAQQYCRQQRGQLDDISMLAFFCVVMPRSVYQQVGPLDERFGIGMFEDDDYNARVRAAGLTVKLARDSFIHHWQRASFKLLGEDEYLRIYYENQDRYRAKSAPASLTAPQRQALSELSARCEHGPGTMIFPPSIGWNIHLFQRPHHLARAFAAHGQIVVFDCTGSHVDEVDLLREIEPGIYLFQGDPSLLRDLSGVTLWTFSYNYAYRDHFPPAIRVVYDWIDDLTVFPYDQTWLGACHKRAVREADIVAAVAQSLHKELLHVRADALYLPNAVDAAHFNHLPDPNPAREDADFARILAAGKPIAGYYGALAEWFDYELMSRVGRLKPDWNFVLLGPELDQSLARSDLLKQDNVHWLGPRDYICLPGYLYCFDVAIIPFKINDITIATSPLKLFEYFAGGRGVVTTPMPECAAFSQVLIASNANEFAEKLEQARLMSGQPDYMSRLASIIEANTWSQRVRQVMDKILT